MSDPLLTDDSTSEMTPEVLAAFSDAWSRHDLEALMSHVTDDCVYGASVGPEPGRTWSGKEQVREGFALMLAFDTGQERHEEGEPLISGTRGAATWSFTGTGPDGAPQVTRGCDIYEFRGGKIARKDAFRKVYQADAPSD
ncbi:nuclear transport factor 2 family protein [Rathayibacter sp. VKM Ac-2804]|jgi:ketosteroid isomerase-like protein|uniref:nuclear transport factor 2 family protein n=1 Tax=unclassified Rathayibacter TaxID=2609250 RepID=UPI00132E8388|nr:MULTISPECIES: nuclear transport factor 2 family protein [unclassified Rathayibacter]NRG42327.1 nuclear transport factor 2 family protein [Rathayibacter sp. VKM Ac-2835]QHF22828.1 nuclear transport factor 2 family protein [Rathayibacter sp. VKM Ac-2804]